MVADCHNIPVVAADCAHLDLVEVEVLGCIVAVVVALAVVVIAVAQNMTLKCCLYLLGLGHRQD